PRDYQKALEYYEQAASLGSYLAEYNIGVMYARGMGVPADNRTAAEWFIRANRDRNPQLATADEVTVAVR
ncbi:MAG: hypothetical protein ACRD3E_11455, partial [Terriglobales bacterium]